jgi:hypothetical protein
MPDILIAAPVKDRAWIIPEWYDHLISQEVEADIYFAALYSPSEDNTRELLLERDVKVIEDSEPGRPVREINSHMWGHQTDFAYMARLRNELITYASDAGFDYFFSVDTDILMPEGSLQKMISFDKPGILAPALKMGVAPVGQPPIWNIMQWVDKDRADYASHVRMPNTDGTADVIMAALLFDRSSLDCRWQTHPQGEDIGLCMDAQRRQVGRYWLGDLVCEHVMIKY